jgi:hypothetical protein
VKTIFIFIEEETMLDKIYVTIRADKSSGLPAYWKGTKT